MIDRTARPYIVFGLNAHKFALTVEQVIEITQVSQLNVMPEMPPHLLGLFLFRGRVVPLINLKARIGLSPTDYVNAEEERVIVVGDNGRWLGLKLDTIYEIVQIEEAKITDLTENNAEWRDVSEGIWASEDGDVLVLKYTAIIDPSQKIDLANWKEAVTH